MLIRGAIYFHTEKSWLPYACIIGGGVLATIAIFIYLIVVYSRLSNKWHEGNRIKRVSIFALILVVAYSTHALFFLNINHFKRPEVKQEIADLHPVIRLAASTLAYIDSDLIITDASRVPEDYRKMGLKTNKNSLHYKQKDGFAYALDLRTNGRPEWINFLNRTYFRLMGFNTLRHVGTDDHLHISMHCHYAPYAI
jgi:hypothetical protein